MFTDLLFCFIATMMRLELLKWDAKLIRTSYGWYPHGSRMYGTAYYDEKFADTRHNVYTHCDTRLLRFLVTDFCATECITECCTQQPRRGTCVLQGVCTFLGRYRNTGIRVVAWEADPQRAHGVQVYFFSPKQRILGMAFMYVQQGKALYEYNPLINEIPAADTPAQYIRDILMETSKFRARLLIQQSIVRVMLDPSYAMCRRRLQRDFERFGAL